MAVDFGKLGHNVGEGEMCGQAGVNNPRYELMLDPTVGSPAGQLLMLIQVFLETPM